jgi:hypothetical protein
MSMQTDKSKQRSNAELRDTRQKCTNAFKRKHTYTHNDEFAMDMHTCM